MKVQKDSVKYIVKLDTIDNFKTLKILLDIKLHKLIDVNYYDLFANSTDYMKTGRYWFFINKDNKLKYNMDKNNYLIVTEIKDNDNNNLIYGNFANINDIKKKYDIDDNLEEHFEVKLLSDIIRTDYNIFNYSDKLTDKLIFRENGIINDKLLKENDIVISEKLNDLTIINKYNNFKIFDNKILSMYKSLSIERDMLFSYDYKISYENILSYNQTSVESNTIILMNKIMNIFSNYNHNSKIIEILEDIKNNRPHIYNWNEFNYLIKKLLMITDMDISIDELIDNKDYYLELSENSDKILIFKKNYDILNNNNNNKLKKLEEYYDTLLRYNIKNKCIGMNNDFQTSSFSDFQTLDSKNIEKFETKFRKFMKVESNFMDTIENDTLFKISGDIKLKYSDFNIKLDNFIKSEVTEIEIEIEKIYNDFKIKYPVILENDLLKSIKENI